MTENETRSWIFLATALASQEEPADLNAISMIADGINHAIPTEKELRTSLTWLTNKRLILKQGRKYTLTTIGLTKYNDANSKTKVLLKIWDNLNKKLMEND